MLSSKKLLIISLMAISLVFTALPIMIANAQTGGIAQYWDVNHWEDIYPELYIGPGDTVKLRVIDLPPGFNDADKIEFNIAESGWGNDYGPPQFVDVLAYDEGVVTKYMTDEIEWTSSVDLTYCNTYTIKYRTNDDIPPGTWVALGRVSDTGPWGGHLHYIPEFAFGTIMSVLSLLSGLGIYAKFKK